MSDDAPELPPVPRVLEQDRNACIARCCLGLTLYTRHRAPEPAAGAARLLSAFLEVAPRERLTLYRTSLTPAWKRVRPNELGALAEDLVGNAIASPVRHLFSFHLADAADAPQTFFHYREVDEARGVGSGYVQLGLPLETPAPVLFQLAMEAAHRVPLWCGVGGFLGSAHPVERCTSFSAFWIWSRRYWGLDVQDPERARFHAQLGLPSINWLTLLSSELVTRLEIDSSHMHMEAEKAGLHWLTTPRCAVLRAGDAPTLGDANRMQDANTYRRAHALLAPSLLETPVRLYGRFWEEEGSARWAKRFLQPEEWT